MMNPFVIKRYTAITISSMMTVVIFYFVTKYYGFIWGCVSIIAGLLFGIVIASALLKNPFTVMLEGKGLLCFTLDSTGIISPFNIQLKQPYVKGRHGIDMIKDVFDRSTVFKLKAPMRVKNPAIMDETGGLSLKLTEKELNASNFALFHFPLLIYNKQIKSFITKEVLGNEEKSLFAEHTILYLNQIMQELTSLTRDFSRYIIESLKPKENFLQSKWTYIILTIVLIIFAIMFGPSIYQAIMKTIPVTSTIGETLKNTGSIITPKG